MNTPARTIQEIAHDAPEDLGRAHIALRQVEAVLWAALAGQGTGQHIRHLLDVAWNLAADGAKTASGDFEAIGKALSGCAPQNAQSEIAAHDSGVRP